MVIKFSHIIQNNLQQKKKLKLKLKLENRYLSPSLTPSGLRYYCRATQKKPLCFCNYLSPIYSTCTFSLSAASALLLLFFLLKDYLLLSPFFISIFLPRISFFIRLRRSLKSFCFILFSILLRQLFTCTLLD